MSRTVYALVDDLLFASKLDTASKGAGVAVVCCLSRDDLLAKARERAPDLIVLDLNAGHLGPVELLGDLAGDDDLGSIPTVGYCSHVDRDIIEAAEAAGCGTVLPRSAFTERLLDILKGEPL